MTESSRMSKIILKPSKTKYIKYNSTVSDLCHIGKDHVLSFKDFIHGLSTHGNVRMNKVTDHVTTCDNYQCMGHTMSGNGADAIFDLYLIEILL